MNCSFDFTLLVPYYLALNLSLSLLRASLRLLYALRIRQLLMMRLVGAMTKRLILKQMPSTITPEQE